MRNILESKYLRIITLILLAQAVLFYSASHGDSRVLERPLAAFPETLPGWQMLTQNVVDQDTRDVLKADDVLSRFYTRAGNGPSIIEPAARAALAPYSPELFVAYFSTQQQGQAPHSPKNCLPGAGWQQTETGELTLPIPGFPRPITVNKYLVSKSDQTSLVLYWYQSHGRVVANEFAAKFYLVADSMRFHRSDTALVRVVVPVVQGNLNDALKSSTEFVQAAFPVIYRFLPM